MKQIQAWDINLELNQKRENKSEWRLLENGYQFLPLISVLTWCPNVIHIDAWLCFVFIITVSFPSFETSYSVLEYAKQIYTYAVKEGVRRIASKKQHLLA